MTASYVVTEMVEPHWQCRSSNTKTRFTAGERWTPHVSNASHSAFECVRPQHVHVFHAAVVRRATVPFQ